MIINIKGKVNFIGQGYFDCADYAELEVRVYNATLTGSEEIEFDTISIDSKGEFLKDVNSTTGNVVVKLYLTSATPAELIAESQHFCHHEELELTFDYDSSTFGDPVYDKIVNKINAVSGANANDLLSLSEDELINLSCLSCVSLGAINRLRAANLLDESLNAFRNDYTYTGYDYEPADVALNNFYDITVVTEEARRAILFALALKALTGDLYSLFSFSEDQLEALLQSAIDRHEIDPAINTAGNRDLLIGSRNARMFNALDDGGNFDGKLIHLTSATYVTKADLLDNALNNGDLETQFSDPPTALDSEIIELKVLGLHLENYPPFMQTVVDGLTLPLDYYQMALDGSSTITALLGAEFPPHYASSAEYASAISASIAAQEPSASVARELPSTTIPWAADVRTVLINGTNREFNIKQQSANTFFVVEDPPANTNGVTQARMNEIQALQRCIRLTGELTSLDVTEALINAEMDSSYAISSTGQVVFMKEMQDRGVAEDVANSVFKVARSTFETLTLLAVQHKRYDSPDAVLPYSARGSYVADGEDSLPDLEMIFGTLNTCECSTCQSVYSPGAYLADMLNWLNRDVAADTVLTPPFTVAYHCLLESYNAVTTLTTDRRKDIASLLLCCENTNTLIPYIDIVNEVLSLAIAPYLQAGDDFQTLKTTDEVRVLPEHRLKQSEDLLKTVYFPWTLPFDPSYYESLVYLKELKRPYDQLVNDFSSFAAQYNTNQWAYAYLEINDDLATLITTIHSGSATFWSDFWGLTLTGSATPKASPVLKVTETSFSELQDLLTSKFIEPAGAIEIVFDAEATDICDFDQYDFLPVLDKARADRLMRFLRLKRKTGLSTLALDHAIITFGVGLLDASLVKKTASALAFCQKHNLDFLEFQEWFSDAVYQEIWSTDFSKWYRDKFMNPLFPENIRDFFSDPINIYNISFTNDHKQMVSTALDISIAQLNFILSHRGLYGLPDQTWLAKVSSYASLINIFQLDVQQLTSIFKLIGDPLDTVQFPDTLKAVWDFERNLAKLNILVDDPNSFIDIIEGTNYYALTSNVSATAFNDEAKESWEKVEEAFQLAHKANPEKEFDDTTPWMPIVAADTDYFKEIIVDALLLSFRIERTTAFNIIDHYNADTSTNWYTDIISDPDEAQTPYKKRDWATGRNFNAKFTPLYRIFTRIQLLADLCGLDESGITYAVNSAAVVSSPAYLYAVPDSPFYWVTNSFIPADISKFFWIADSTQQANKLQLYNPAAPDKTAQQLYFEEVTLYYNKKVANISPDYGEGDTNVLYDKLGSSSQYRSVSIQEFHTLFLHAEGKIDIPNDLVDVVTKMDQFIAATTDIGTKFSDAWYWVWTTSAGTIPANLSLHSEDIRRVLNSRYPQFKSWSKYIIPIQDDFRMKLRDALVAYHIGTRGFEDTNDLFTYYLIDNQMSPCMLISRVVAAHASVQLLIHRALLGLEPAILMSDANKKEWEWRKNYRVWEANRKVFCYPENWIDPSLRTDKSELFLRAEEVLQQDDINATNTELAYNDYLTGLNEISKLDIRATYNEYPDQLQGKASYSLGDPVITHVFARTWNPPYQYYHRTSQGMQWSPWKKIDVELETDHLIPVRFNRKLYLFFPIFIEKVFQNDEQRKYYEIKLCYIKYDQGKWSSKKILDGKLLAGTIAYHNVENSEKNLFLLTGTYINIWGWENYRTQLWIGKEPDGGQPGPLQVLKNNGKGNNYLYYINIPPGKNYSNDGRTQLHFDFASMDKKDFYFWANPSQNGDLVINVRRACMRDPNDIKHYVFDTTDFAFESRFLITPDERVQVIPPAVISASGHGNGPYILERPWGTMPFYQQMVEDTMHPHGSTGLRIRFPRLGVYGSSSQDMLLGYPPTYTLTYPHQYQHAHLGTPFFYSDKNRNFYFRPKTAYDYGAKQSGTGYEVVLNEHPFSREMLDALNRYGVEGVLDSGTPDLKRQAHMITESDSSYPNGYIYSWRIHAFLPVLPPLQYDFDVTGTYSHYNWEVFFHSVSLIGRQLRLSGKYKDAFQWLSYIFDPTNRDANIGSVPTAKHWKVKPFLIDVTNGSIQNMMRTLAAGPGSPYFNQIEKDKIRDQVVRWRANPFDPHKIAAFRPRAYMLWTVSEFIQNIIDWADSLFRQDTIETITEAINLYVVASEMLGEKPKKVARPTTQCKSFSDMIDDIDPYFSNLFVEFENITSTSLVITEGDFNGSSGATYLPGGSGGTTQLQETTSNISVSDLYFCIPDNPQLNALWEKVEDRLFKIRHCMNIEGKKRELALFSAPIDPALLVRAVAGGLSIEDALEDLAAPLPHYRFSYLVQKANEFNNDVKALGSQLLTILEKKDGEELSLFRQVHEQNILRVSRGLKLMAIEDAKQSLETLRKSKNLIQIRLDDYQNRKFTNTRELTAQGFTKKSEDMAIVEQGVRSLAGLLNLIPDFYASAPPKAKVFGGSKISTLVNAGANVLGIISTVNRNKASMSLTFAGYDRRQEDWNLQIKTASEELTQVDRQILGAEIKVAVAEKELENHDMQVTQSEEMYDWLKEKYTNKNLYSWMEGQVKSVYKKTFNLAYDLAKRAQVCLDYELGTSATNIIQYGHWDTTKSGLLAGEALSLQLRQLEAKYIKENARELEMSKNISLALLDPSALESLIIQGNCTFQLPEYLFDLDHPGQYKRRIKSVSVSIPCISGSNTNINAILSLTKADIRRTIDGTYTVLDPQGIPQESIATSSAQNDSGMFELNFKDERYLPFEGKGAISEWTLELSQIDRSSLGGGEVIRQFDFQTITDVIIHMKYSAKYDGNFATTVKEYIVNNLGATTADKFGGNILHAFSLRHDMPNLWHEFVQSGEVIFQLEKNRLPYLLQALNPMMEAIEIYAFPKSTVTGALDLTLTDPGSTFSSTAFNTLSSPKAVDPIYGQYTFGAAINLNYDLKLVTVNPLKTNIEDVMIISKIKIS